MCVVIDVNIFSKVFRGEEGYRILHDWLTKGNGKMIIGGTKYSLELKRMPKYAKVLLDLERNGSVIRVEKSEVDRMQEILEERITSDCDDPHIIALMDVSGCLVFCTEDKRSEKYITNKNNYSDKKTRKIFKGHKKQSQLISDKYIVGICKTC